MPPVSPAVRPPRPRASFGRRLLLAAAATGVALLLAEVAARVLAWLALAEQPRVPPGQQAALAQLIRPVRSDRRVYELIPGLDVRFQGHQVVTDADGWRIGGAGAAAPATGSGKPIVRIVGLGDSVMFGWGVAEADGFLRQLETLLRERHPEVDWRATNTAVPGYNTVMEVATLQAKALTPPPQLVLIDLVDNDLDLPNFIAHEADYWTLSTSFLVEWIESVRRGFDTQAFRPFELAPRRGEGLYLGDPERVPARYRELVGERAFAAALAELAGLAREHRFEVLATSHLGFSDVARAALQAAGLRSVETLPDVQRYQQQHGIASYRGALTVSADDPHPNAVVHHLQAEAILRELAASGVLARLRR